MFILKNKYCLHCTKKGHYFCDESTSRAWPFQQELAKIDIVSCIEASKMECLLSRERRKGQQEDKFDLHGWYRFFT